MTFVYFYFSGGSSTYLLESVASLFFMNFEMPWRLELASLDLPYEFRQLHH